MPSSSETSKSENMRRELLALMLASLACVVVLTVSIVERPTLAIGGVDVQHILLFVLVAGIAVAAAALCEGLMPRTPEGS